MVMIAVLNNEYLMCDAVGYFTFVISLNPQSNMNYVLQFSYFKTRKLRCRVMMLLFKKHMFGTTGAGY